KDYIPNIKLNIDNSISINTSLERKLHPKINADIHFDKNNVDRIDNQNKVNGFKDDYSARQKQPKPKAFESNGGVDYESGLATNTSRNTNKYKPSAIGMGYGEEDVYKEHSRQIEKMTSSMEITDEAREFAKFGEFVVDMSPIGAIKDLRNAESIEDKLIAYSNFIPAVKYIKKAYNFIKSIGKATKLKNIAIVENALPKGYKKTANGIIGPKGGEAKPTGIYDIKSQSEIYKRKNGSYYIVDRNGKQIKVKSPYQHGNTLGNQPTDVYKLYDKDGNFLKYGISKDHNTRYSKKELNLGRTKQLGTKKIPRKRAEKIERYLTEKKPGIMNKESWAGKRDPNHPNYDPNYIPKYKRKNNK
ncbi:hypothetical protein, partial [Pasteurella atlantica]|uniref:hypothetical protein n=2 Tax=Pasteurellaceae TaxID=712 RepID=UPI0027514680